MDIQEVARVIRGAIDGTARIAFFVGAGISMEGNLCPGFSRLNAQVMASIAGGGKKFEDYLAKHKIAENERARPEVVLQIARDEISPQAISCLDTLIGDNLNFYHQLLAKALQVGNWVFTTNFENRIDVACKEIGFTTTVCSSDEDFYRYLFHSRQESELPGGYLFKLHGTINEEQSMLDERFETIIMTLNEVGRGLSKYKAEVLRTFLQKHDFVFIGYRCMDEFDINDVLLSTKSDKRIIYFQYKERPEYKPEHGEFPSVISNRKSLEDEKNQEGQDRSIIHVNNLLLGRPEACKVVGNPRNLMKEIYQSIIKKPNSYREQVQLSEESEKTFSWAQDISDEKRRLFFGRLLLHLGLWDDAVKCLRPIGDTVARLKATAMFYIGDAWRETEEESGYEEAINSYRASAELFERGGDFASAAGAKAQMGNVMRLAKKSISEVEKHLREAKELLEREILPGYAATLNILGLVSYQKRFEEKWRREYWLENARDLCEKSMRIGEIIGDQARIARAGNALSLVLNDQAELHHDKGKIIQAIDLLESILPEREAAADLRLCFQIHRNLGLTHKTKMSFVETEAEKAVEQETSEKHFAESRRYAEMGKERPGQRLETIYREGMLYFETGNQSKAIPMLDTYVKKQGIPDRRATGLKFLGLAHAESGMDDQASKCFKDIVDIYEEMSDSQLQELRGNPDRKLRAKENLLEAVAYFEQRKNSPMAQRARELAVLIES